MLKFLLILITLSILSFSQEDFELDDLEYKTKRFDLDLPYFIGGFGGFNSISANNNIPLIPLSDDCGIFSYGRGEDILIGLEGGISFFFPWISNDIRIFYESRPLTLEAESIGPRTLNQSNQYVSFVRDHEWKASLKYLSFETGVRFRPLMMIEDNFGWVEHKWFPMYWRVGFEVGQPTFDSFYENTEFVNSPENALFPNGRKSRVTERGEIKGGSTTTALNFEIGLEVKTIGNLHFSPFFSYRQQMQAPYEQYDWDVEVVRIGTGIGFHVNQDAFDRKRQEELVFRRSKLKTAEIDIVKIEDDPIQKEQEIDFADEIDFDDKGKIIKTTNIQKFDGNPLQITETVVTQTYPILPYLFFDDQSSEIRDIYLTDSKGFKEKDLPKNTIGIYYNVLKILGSRLKENPSVNLTLVGNTNGIEKDDKFLRLELAYDRAKNIKDYLVDEWGIDGNRIEILSKDIPTLATRPESDEGRQENRRVEIIASDKSLFKPVLHSKFLEYTTNEQGLKFDIVVSENENIKNSTLSLKVGNSEITKGQVVDNKVIFPPNVLKKIALSMSNADQITAQIIIEKDNEEDEIKTIKLPYSKSRSNFEVGRLNLIVFDFDKSEITDQNKNMIDQFITGAISDNSTTDIIGSTDLLGERNYNKELSQQRADAVADYIHLINPDYKFDSVKGIGSSTIPFDNDLPEGRFYCRTVLVEVKTPVK